MLSFGAADLVARLKARARFEQIHPMERFMKKPFTAFLATLGMAATLAVANPLQAPNAAPEQGKVDPLDQDFEIALSHYESGNYAKSLALATKGAKEGHPGAQMLLATMYKDGVGVEQSFTEAKVWYEQAGKQGHVLAQFHLGVMYEQGVGTPQDYTQAMHWYGKAGELGFNYAQFNLGVMFLQGRGAEPNAGVAREWFSRSCDGGIQMGCEAAELLGAGAPGKEGN